MKKILLLLLFLFNSLFAVEACKKYDYFDIYAYGSGTPFMIYNFNGCDPHDSYPGKWSLTHLQSSSYYTLARRVSCTRSMDANPYVTGYECLSVSHKYSGADAPPVCFGITCSDNQIYDKDVGKCIDKCQENETYNSSTGQCECFSGYKRQYEQCVPDCTQNVPQTADAPDGWEKYINIDSAQECSSLAKNFDYNQANFSSQTDSRGCVYNVCYVNEKTADINNSLPPEGPPNCTEPTVFPDTPYGFILRGTVKSVDECQAFVDNVNYTDFRVIPVTDCSGTYEFCYLKTSIDNNDTGITPPPSDSNDTNISNVVPPVTPPPPSTSNNTDLIGVNQKLAQNNSLDSIRNQKLNDIADGSGQIKNLMGAWINQSRLDNNNQLNAQRQTVSATNRVKNGIDKLNGDLCGKLDTLIDNTQKIVDKNSSVDLSGVEDKLDTLHKDLNSSNAKLSKIADAFNTDDNVTYPDTGLDDNSSAPSLSDLLPSDSWFSDNTLDLSNINNYTGDCYLESFSWTDGSGTHTFPPQALMDMIPFNVVSNIMFAFLYLLGLREFLRS